jgi:SNF2 family DNA or RNA helicase
MIECIDSIYVNKNSIIINNILKVLKIYDELCKIYNINKPKSIKNLCDYELIQYNLFLNNNYLIDIISNHILDNNNYELFLIYNKLVLSIQNNLLADILNNSIITDISIININNIKTTLYPYQINNVNWMINIENRIYDERFNKIKDKFIFYGGGLFDQVGMGKTLQIITLINNNISKNTDLIKNNKLYSRATLIIIPNHLCGQWLREFEKHIIKPLNIINLLTKRHYDKFTFYDLITADIVIVSVNYFKNCDLKEHDKINPLYNVQNIFKTQVNIYNLYWYRVVIDEFHEIENLNLFFKIKYLESDFRWIISGTPFQENYTNTKEELLHSSFSNILDYLLKKNDCINRIDLIDLDNYNYIKNHFSRNTHKKNIKILKLPEIVYETHWLNFTDTEQMIYNAYLANPNNNEYDIFLRQICCHPMISNTIRENISNKVENLSEIQDIIKKMYFSDYEKLEKNYNELIEKNSKINLEIEEYVKNSKTELGIYKKLKEDFNNNNQKIIQIKKEKDGLEQTLIYYKKFLEILSDMEKIKMEQCTICLDNIKENDLGITTCGHIYCYSCIITVLKENNNSNSMTKCPICNKNLKMNNIYLITKNISNDVNMLGTKLSFIINYIKKTPTKFRIIFSQWDYLLKEVGKILALNDIKHLYCQGNVYQKDKVLQLFNEKNGDDNEYKIIMLSTKSTVSGSNLTNAEEVIFLDPIYGDLQYRLNIENQAIGRVRRLGNKFKIIKIIRILIKNTVEEKIYNSNKN